MPMRRDGNPGETGAIEGNGSALDARDGKGYISCLHAPSGWHRRSAWSGPDCRFTGRGNRSEPALAGYQHFGALMNRSNRIDHIRLTSHPDPNAKVRFPIHWGASSA